MTIKIIPQIFVFMIFDSNSLSMFVVTYISIDNLLSMLLLEIFIDDNINVHNFVIFVLKYNVILYTFVYRRNGTQRPVIVPFEPPELPIQDSEKQLKPCNPGVFILHMVNRQIYLSYK